ncbi:MAG: putative histidine kinase, partial [Holophagaceae bacterium]|nr:putative histidine kinase [Holophagaceae bacterium]
MARTMCLLTCRNFEREAKAVLAAEGWMDVQVATCEARCGLPPMTWEELRPLVAPDCSQVVLLGQACAKDLLQGPPPSDWPSVRLIQTGNCFGWVAGDTLVAEALARGAYLVTPGWLEDWRGELARLGFDERHAGAFFEDFARELVLLDTGVSPEAVAQFEAFAAVVGLPAARLGVGLDHARLFLARLVAEWRLEEVRRQAEAREQVRAREWADHLAAMDFLKRLILLTDEQEAISAIEEMFHLLFAPRQLHYVRFEEDQPQFEPDVPADLREQILGLTGDWTWIDSAPGFILRIAFAGETLGALVVGPFEYPAYRERYLNLAWSVVGVCGLAIGNARTYRRMRDVDEALRRSERSLALAQSIAHLGHWEWDLNTDELTWSEETCRILGFPLGSGKPTKDGFLQVIHPEDRPMVEEQIRQAQVTGRFDIEYRLNSQDGRVRVVRGMGEVVYLGADRQPRIIGTLRNLMDHEQVEVLGIIQDITDRKELEWKLEQEARTDPLTGCANRRHFLQKATQEFVRLQRYGGEFAVFMLDLDHFKSVNDRFGHAAGDATLVTLVEICTTVLRVEDVVGRWGGEEFVVLLPETGHDRAVEVAERLCCAVAGTPVTPPEGPPFHFTASIGVASWSPGDTGVDLILGRADRALYEAKHAGRNRVVGL